MAASDQRPSIITPRWIGKLNVDKLELINTQVYFQTWQMNQGLSTESTCVLYWNTFMILKNDNHKLIEEKCLRDRIF